MLDRLGGTSFFPPPSGIVGKNVLEIWLKCVSLGVAAIHERSVTSRL
jgi:hypothetical protein